MRYLGILILLFILFGCNSRKPLEISATDGYSADSIGNSDELPNPFDEAPSTFPNPSPQPTIVPPSPWLNPLYQFILFSNSNFDDYYFPVTPVEDISTSQTILADLWLRENCFIGETLIKKLRHCGKNACEQERKLCATELRLSALEPKDQVLTELRLVTGEVCSNELKPQGFYRKDPGNNSNDIRTLCVSHQLLLE